MVKIALTDLGVQKLTEGTYFDTKTPAFGIRVGKHRKTWIATKGRERRVVTLGHYPSLSLKMAREKAYLALAAPAEVRVVITFPDARDAFLAQGAWRPQTKRVLTYSLRHFRWAGQLGKITREHVVAELDAIKGRSARAHALKDIRTFFNWCVPRYLASSPAHGLKMEKQASRSRVLTNEELTRVWKASGDMSSFGVIVRLLILTGQRRTEIGSLHWSYVGADRIIWPPEVKKNNREHVLPLGTVAASLLPSRGNGYMFTARGSDTPFCGWSSSLHSLHKLSRTAGWTIHDLRRTVATGMASVGVPIHVTERILHHVSGTQGGIIGIYQRYDYWEEQVQAIQRWEERVLSLARP